ncbi:nicotinate-nucleotide--dimethylbenzimidazole phosphoribosyltransferase [Yunchengibacter salinarum]|uniref:nicotinate-nucleotide--dimethylbenzimidazole phosphoribosyltransferase n=1 Tax=Yunchengibacter salinarum TaxID=3133399 RepID=UPI0035B5B251
MTDHAPFDDLRSLLAQLPSADNSAFDAARAALTAKGTLDVPPGLSPHGLPGLAAFLAAWQGRQVPGVRETHNCLFAASYQGGPPPQDIRAWVDLAARGRAPVNLLSVRQGLGLRVLEMAVDMPHSVTPANPAWSEKDCMAAVAFGMEATAQRGDVLGLGDLAFGNQAAASALIVYLLAMGPDMLDPKGLSLYRALEQAGTPADPLDALRRLGGPDIAAMVGAIIAARSARLPVLLDGWAALAGAAVLHALSPDAISHCLVASADEGVQATALERLGHRPLTNAGSGAGPGAALALAAGILEQAVSLFDLVDGA